MATIKSQGKGYKITVSKGYDIYGRQLREHMTWVPAPGMTEKQIDKELNRQATLFEEQVRCSTVHNGSIRLKDFTDSFINAAGCPNLKAKTLFGYQRDLVVINEALGHIKLKDLKPGHIASFYANLQEEGARATELATIYTDFSILLKERHLTMKALSEKAGVSLWVMKQLKNKEKIAKDCAL